MDIFPRNYAHPWATLTRKSLPWGEIFLENPLGEIFWEVPISLVPILMVM